ncbi:MAG: hypothetical protein A3F83_10430 [Candidatus Glassbacteria bacterium RIFCSPLOWO2_12_FULL_58_11]|uniref:Uncharacterized protein n=1 Tax=Candidatus Glassbacteria bacterium RIFCSPLOWO2_12_FULL_58_11 TaxID=1817867 RepID=A0A1F5YK14_9BACT|nr:MAG: hypothetical protein A3F83_10430 [Candidatus Glassbacteria bacterium RIFCSPLOWO2_12_FULL_58_11]
MTMEKLFLNVGGKFRLIFKRSNWMKLLLCRIIFMGCYLYMNIVGATHASPLRLGYPGLKKNL